MGKPGEKCFALSLIVCFMTLGAGDARAQSISTYAGGGPVGDGRPATEATLSSPSWVVVAPDGDLYISGAYNNLVRRVDGATGVISTVAGGGNNGAIDGVPGTQTQLLFPQGIALDASGNLFIADNGHFRICRVDAETGILSTIGGGGSNNDDGVPANEAPMLNIRGLGVDATGSVVYAEAWTHRVRRIDRETGLVATIAGNGTRGYSGDGGPATEAQLDRPRDLTFDAEGNLYIIGNGTDRVRRVDAETGIIESLGLTSEAWGIAQKDGVLYISVDLSRVITLDLTTMEESPLAGTGEKSFYGDGGPAAQAALNAPFGLDLDTEGNLFIPDASNQRVRRVAVSSGLIDTVAGGGSVGDGGPANAAILSTPSAVELTPAGGLLIGSLFEYRLRLVDPSTRIISTIAGDGIEGHSGDGGPAVDARLTRVNALDTDSLGNIYVGSNYRVRRIDADTGIIELIAGNGVWGYSGDGGPATEASFGLSGLAVDDSGNLFISDGFYNVIRRVDGQTGIITTVAGTGEAGFSGDGGPAIEAQFNDPVGLVLDGDTKLLIADHRNHRVRQIDLTTSTITTLAGSGEGDSTGDGGPATEAGILRPRELDLDGSGNLYIATDWFLDSRIRRIDAETGIITTLAGISGGGDYRGDGGPASEASLSTARDLAVDDSGNVFLSEVQSNRVRAVFACLGVEAPILALPGDAATGLSTAPTLTWTPAKGSFYYDVILDTSPSPSTVVATDVKGTSFTPSNLQSGVTYYWKVIANGDPFCTGNLTAASEVRSFTTLAACDAPATPSLVEPAGGSAITTPSVTLSWAAATGASRYDVHLGTTNPPPLIRTTSSTNLSASGLVEGNTYYWAIVAHASCDESQTSRSEVRSFDVVGSCTAAGTFDLVSPSNGSSGVSTSLSLEWSASANASDYDLFLGTTNPPQIFLPDMRETGLRISGLVSNTTYYWQVRADVDCDDTKSRMTNVGSFTTIDDCKQPQGTTIAFTPPGDVGVGQTYAITWREARGLDSAGTYLVERSLDSSFSTIHDTQEVSTTAATFLANALGMHYHRVRPVMGCNAGVVGPVSGTAAVKIVAEKPNIIFTVEPDAVVATPGRALEDLRTNFTIENIASSPSQVVIAQALIDSVPFFTVSDPLGGDAVFVTLQPREPKSFEVRFSGPPNDVEEAYQGLIALSVANSPIIPYAFVNLKVGDRGTATPEFRVGGVPAEYTFFPGFDGDDSSRPPITIEIHNPGSTPMELGAEIGPEIWLEADSDWNETPIPAGSTRSVALYTRRTRAYNGSALPRYTWFGVRTKTGETARILVQDNDAAAVGVGRDSALEPDEDSLVIPEVVSEMSVSGMTLISQVRLTNLGSDEVQADMIFTPSSSDGFSEAVRRATVVVPPNDVATLTDPLVQIFGLGRPISGQLEVRAAEAKIGLLKVETSVVSADRAESSLVRVPTIRRGDGARAGLSHQIAGITRTASSSTRLVLAETSGTDIAKVTLQLFDSAGSPVGTTDVTVARYGHVRIDDLVMLLGGSLPLSAGRLTIAVSEGGGSVAALGLIEEAGREYAAVLLSRPVADGVNVKFAMNSIGRRDLLNGVTASLVAPYVASGTVDAGSGVEYSTLMGFVAPFLTSLDFFVTFTDSSGQSFERTVSVLGGSIVEYQNVLRDLFGVSGAVSGSIVIETDPRGQVYSRLVAGGSPAGALDLASPVSELVTMVDSARPLYVDGMEQSTDPERGARWNLYVREIAGESGTITIRLYEAGNRTHPIAVKHIALDGNAQLSLETVFDAMDLNSDARRKDRANVLCMVTPDSGEAVVTAVALEIDNRTGTATSHTLKPSSGLSASGAAPTLVRVVDLGTPVRRRPVRR